jgi:hypothetical protein
MRRLYLTFAALAAVCPLALAADWPMLGRDHTRNAVSPEKNPPTDWQVANPRKKTENRNIKWSVELGTYCFSDLVISEGLIWIGTNNERPRDP